MSSRSIVFFDGVCNLCNKSVQTILKYDKGDHFVFASLQGETAAHQLNAFLQAHPGTDSILLKEGEKIFVRSTAVLRIARHLAFPVNLAFTFIIVPVFIRDRVYNWVAANRYKWFGRQESCWLPDPSLQPKFLP